MTYAYIVEDASFENIMDDPDFYLGMFDESKVLAFPELNLKNGDSLDCDTFPVLISS